jgi:hypothetical protein
MIRGKEMHCLLSPVCSRHCLLRHLAKDEKAGTTRQWGLHAPKLHAHTAMLLLLR